MTDRPPPLRRRLLCCAVMVNLRAELRKAIVEAVARAQTAGELPAAQETDVSVQYPPATQEALGDYASPVAHTIAKRTRKKPMEIVEIIAKHFTPPEFVGKVEGVEPGFLNFRLNPGWLVQKLDDVIEEGTRYGQSELGQGTTVNLEFVSANPTGLPTFGNGRALFWADTLGRVLQASGYAVTREYYVNDLGTQVERYGESVLRRILEAHGEDIPFPEELYQGEDVKVVARRVEERITEDTHHVFSVRDLEDPTFLQHVTRIAVDETVRAIREVLEEVCQVHFDVWTFEHVLHERGDVQAVLAALAKGNLTYEQDDALWFRSTKFGDDKDRVLVRKGGQPTYFVGDIAYHRDKFRRGYQLIADFWGADHHGDIPRLTGALKALGEDTSRIRFLLAQMVAVVERGERKKMSKRAGTAVPLHEMVEIAGLSAARFFLTMMALSSHMEFDVDLAREQTQRNPVYYVQYAHVRLSSLLRKAREQNILDGDIIPPLGARVPLTHTTELALMRQLFRFPEVVEDVAVSWDVQRLPHYASTLAKAIHLFYDAVPVLGADDAEVKSARLTLALAAKTALGNVLDLLGVEKRDIM